MKLRIRVTLPIMSGEEPEEILQYLNTEVDHIDWVDVPKVEYKYVNCGWEEQFNESS